MVTPTLHLPFTGRALALEGLSCALRVCPAGPILGMLADGGREGHHGCGWLVTGWERRGTQAHCPWGPSLPSPTASLSLQVETVDLKLWASIEPEVCGVLDEARGTLAGGRALASVTLNWTEHCRWVLTVAIEGGRGHLTAGEEERRESQEPAQLGRGPGAQTWVSPPTAFGFPAWRTEQRFPCRSRCL